MKRVVAGILRFKQHAYESRRALFAELATGQDPEALFITCADSRVDPNLVTQSEPGDLFICRNAGNIVPPHKRVTGGVTASVEFAVAGLGVRDVIVCGHTDCGAVKGALNPAALEDLPHVHDWLEHVEPAVAAVAARHGGIGENDLLAVIEQNVLVQLENLKTHPSVRAAIERDQLGLHGWVYHIESGSVTCYDEERGAFVPAEERYASLLASTHAGES